MGVIMNNRFLKFMLLTVGFQMTGCSISAMQLSEFEQHLHSANIMHDKNLMSQCASHNQELKKDFSGYYVMSNRLKRIELSNEYNNECAKYCDNSQDFLRALNKYIKPFVYASKREKREGCCFFYVNFFLQESYPDLFEKITIQLKHEGRWSGIDSIEESFHDLEFELIKKFINEFMVETDTPQAGDLILYYEGPQDKISSASNTKIFYDIRHVGIMNSENEVRSKWGWYDQCIYVHDVGNTLAEYGSYVKFWTLKVEHQNCLVNKERVVEPSNKNSVNPWCSIL